MTILNMLDISTAHISLKTSELLAEIEDNPIVFSTPFTYGFFVYVPTVDEEETPQDLKDVFAFARKNKCSWIKLDCDAVEYKELPKYDWN